MHLFITYFTFIESKGTSHEKIRLFVIRLVVVERYYLMVALMVALALLGQLTLTALFGFAIAVSAILGLSYKGKAKKCGQYQARWCYKS